MNDIKELKYGTLDQVSGGRKIYKSELNEYMNVISRKFEAKYMALRNEGKRSEASALYDAYTKGVIKYSNDIREAPEGSPEIPFGNYFDLTRLDM